MKRSHLLLSRPNSKRSVSPYKKAHPRSKVRKALPLNSLTSLFELAYGPEDLKAED
jgi:hypothetical protein